MSTDVASRLIDQFDRYKANGGDLTTARWTLSPKAWKTIRDELGMAVEPTTILGLPAHIDNDLPDSLVLLDER